LTTYANYKLLVNLTWTDGSSGYALYDSFSVSGPDDWYRLSLGNYSGTAGTVVSFLLFEIAFEISGPAFRWITGLKLTTQ